MQGAIAAGVNNINKARHGIANLNYQAVAYSTVVFNTCTKLKSKMLSVHDHVNARVGRLLYVSCPILIIGEKYCRCSPNFLVTSRHRPLACEIVALAHQLPHCLKKKQDTADTYHLIASHVDLGCIT